MSTDSRPTAPEKEGLDLDALLDAHGLVQKHLSDEPPGDSNVMQAADNLLDWIPALTEAHARLHSELAALRESRDGNDDEKLRADGAPSAVGSRASVAALVIAEVNRRDIPHRKGWRLSKWSGGPPTLEHLREEVDELQEALDASVAADNVNEAGKHYAHAREECADVFACTLQTAYRLGMNFAALDAEAERKVRLRFPGADAIDVTGGRTADEAPQARSKSNNATKARESRALNDGGNGDG